ncbi:MAG: tetratricopeptide repeat protein [Candidatus Latescibacterota bacterium]|nr:MAG: tetratricopeptide repeat protein [Candidatus Latescibacterota bacterium]
MRKAHVARGERRRLTRRCGLALVAALVWAVAGCAGGSRGALQPRTRDVEALQREAAAQPHATEPLYQLALLAYAERRSDDAVRALHEALQRDPDYEPALTLWARLLFESGRSAEGVLWFARRPHAAWPEAVQLNLALLLADVGQSEVARRMLHELQEGVHAQAAAANLAWLDLVAGDAESATARLETLALGDDMAPQVLNNLALAHLHNGDVEASAGMLDILVQEHPDFAPAQLNRALLLRYFLFDDEAAAMAEQMAESQAPPRLSDDVVQELLRDSEDTSPATDAEETP